MTSNPGICFGIAAAALFALAAPSRANAGGPIITAQQLAITLKTVSQTDTSSGNLKPDNFTAKTNDIFAACVGTPPTKTQGIYLFLNCSDLSVGGTILAIETQPLTSLAAVGTMAIDTDLLVATTKDAGMTRTSAIAPVEISISCNGGATTAEFFGVMSLKFSALGSAVCPDSGQVKILGAGHNTPPGDFIVNSGSSIAVKKRAAGISTIP
jgi:hypothetical protein